MLHRFTYRVILTCFCAWRAGVVRYVGYGAALCRVWRGCVSGACGCGAKQHTLGSSLASGRMRVAPADRALSQEDAGGSLARSDGGVSTHRRGRPRGRPHPYLGGAL